MEMLQRAITTIEHYNNGNLTKKETIAEFQFLALAYFECGKIGLAKANSLITHIYEWGKGEITNSELIRRFA